MIPARHLALPHAELRARAAARVRALFDGQAEPRWELDPSRAVEMADLAAGLVDAYALSLHVLWTYQEAWGEEGFLGTARLDASADRLLAELGYHLGPGTAAAGLQHVRCRAGSAATLPVGFAFVSKPSVDGREGPAVFESTAVVTLSPALNELRAFPVAFTVPSPAPSGPLGNTRPPPRGSGGIVPRRPLSDDLAQRLDDERLGDEAARRAMRAKQEAARLSEMMRIVRERTGGQVACQSLQAVCHALAEAQAASQVDTGQRALGALTESQMIVARQLRQLAARQSNVADLLERALARCADESDADYAGRLGAMAAFLDGFVLGLIQESRDRVALLRGQDALVRLDRAYAGDGPSRLGSAPAGTDTLFLLDGRDPLGSGAVSGIGPGDWLVFGDELVVVDEAGKETRTRTFREAVRVLTGRREAPEGLIRTLTRVTFAPPLERAYNLDRTVILGNVVPVTHGETVEEHPAPGSDDPRFLPLGRGPLTWVRDPAAPAGRRPEVNLTVNGRVWRRLDNLLEAAPGDEVFAVELVPGGGARLRVGEGALPADADVVVRYRVGVGVTGNRAARRIDDMARAHPAVDSTFNPLALDGGSDPESRALARVRGPQLAAAMDRAASAADLRALALACDGVSRARVFIEGTARRARAVVVLSGPGGGELGPALLADLTAHLQVRVPPGVTVVVQNRIVVPVHARLLLRLVPGTDPLLAVRAARLRLGVDRLDGVAPGLLDPDRTDLDDDLQLSQVYGSLEDLPGLTSLVVKALWREGSTRGLSDRIVTGPRELLSWAPDAAGDRGVTIHHQEARDL